MLDGLQGYKTTLPDTSTTAYMLDKRLVDLIVVY